MPKAETPLVSVHVITYNHQDFIGPALQSAVDQDYERLEIVVADDGSNDGTRDIVADFQRRYPGRVVAILEEHLGITGNYNRALKRCTGKYVAILNGDDLYLPGKIAAQVAWLEEKPARALCAHDVEHFDSATGATRKLHSQTGAMRRGVGPENFIVNGCPFASVSVMVRREGLPPQGMSDRLKVVLDWKFSIDALLPGGEYGYVDGVYARYRVHSGNVINTRKEEMWLDVMTSLALIEGQRPDLARSVRQSRSRCMYRKAIRAVQQGRQSEAQSWFQAAFTEDPLQNLKLPGWYALSRLPDGLRKKILRRPA